MENMNCFECVSKHLSVAISYGKEVLSGHGKGADLDHRPDFLGEIINAEHHLQQMNKELFEELSNFRKELQSRNIEITNEDIDFIRKLFLKAENTNGNTKVMFHYEAKNKVDIVFISPKNQEYFDFTMESIKKYLNDYNNIYVLQPSINCEKYEDIKIISEPFSTFCKNEQLSDDYVIIPQNSAFLKQTNARKIPATFMTNIKDIQFLKIHKKLKDITNKSIFCCDNVKPQIVNKKLFNSTNIDFDNKYILTQYFYLNNIETINDYRISVNITKPVCCNTKSQLKAKHYVRWNDENFQSLKNYLKK